MYTYRIHVREEYRVQIMNSNYLLPDIKSYTNLLHSFTNGSNLHIYVNYSWTHNKLLNQNTLNNDTFQLSSFMFNAQPDGIVFCQTPRNITTEKTLRFDHIIQHRLGPIFTLNYLLKTSRPAVNSQRFLLLEILKRKTQISTHIHHIRLIPTMLFRFI